SAEHQHVGATSYVQSSHPSQVWPTTEVSSRLPSIHSPCESRAPIAPARRKSGPPSTATDSPFSAPRYAFNAPEWLTCFLRMRLRFTPTSMPATDPRSFYISQNFPMATIGGTELPPRLDERTSQHKMKKYISLLILFSLCVASAHSQPQSAGDYWVYFGTYTGFVYMKEGL